MLIYYVEFQLIRNKFLRSPVEISWKQQRKYNIKKIMLQEKHDDLFLIHTLDNRQLDNQTIRQSTTLISSLLIVLSS